MVVAKADGRLSVTVKVSVPAASSFMLDGFTAMDTLGVSSSAAPTLGVAVLLPARKTLVLLPSSLIVPVPAAPAALVTAPVMAPVSSVNDSAPSNVASAVMDVLTSTEVTPAASVIPPDDGTHAAPSKYSSAALAPVSAPTEAVPLKSTGVNAMAPVLARSRLTWKTA
ncbi:hypothetical protein [Roseateles sp. BYS96W]|uniref:Uncharacterized protein n=1 Tax=Pelomonas nitida TaxID=3299027 RepID=A0ABW7G1J2_9BURK